MADSIAKLPVRTAPFPSWIDKYLDPNNATYVEIKSSGQLYEIMSHFLVKRIDQSYQMAPKGNVSEAARLLQKLAKEAAEKDRLKKEKEKAKDDKDKTDDKDKDTTVTTVKKDDKNKKGKEECCDSDDDEEDDSNKVALSLGLGIHSIMYKNEKLYIIHQTIGKPLCSGWSCSSPQFHKSLVLMVEGKNKLQYLKQLCSDAIRASEDSKDKLYFSIYRWDAESQYWRWSGEKIGRNLDTIILPSVIKNKLVNDITRFLDKESIRWYFEHGIPYKRSYLFYGVPGSGKSSLIQSLAMKFDRNLAFLQPTHPKMTDESFKSCIQQAPANSLIVLEDIDALFNKDRSKKHSNCPLTFSGLLNGLDGVGNPDGQIFILTTNFVDQLDEALIRSGRVDLHIQFPMATDEQLENIFKLFYPGKEIESKEFVVQIRKYFEKGISMASVQQHFIQNMFIPAKECVNAVSKLSQRLDVVAELNEKTKIEEEDEDEDENKDDKKEEPAMKKEDIITKLKESFTKIEDFSKNNKEFETLLDSFVKQYNEECKKQKEKEEKEKKEKDDKEDDKSKDKKDKDNDKEKDKDKDNKDKDDDKKEKDKKEDKDKDKDKDNKDSKDDKTSKDSKEKKSSK